MTLLDSILNKAKGRCDAAEVFRMSSENIAAEWSADKLKLAETKETSGIAIRVISNGKVGFFATNKLSDPDKIVETALELAPYGTDFAGELPSSCDSVNGQFYDEKAASASIDDLINLGNEVISTSKSAANWALFDSKIDRSVLRIEFANSLGAKTEYSKTSFGGYISGSVTKEGDVFSIYEFDESSVMNGALKDSATLVAKKLQDASKIVEIPAGDYQCILTPKAQGVFGPLQLALNARAVLKEISPFCGKIGERIFDERVTLIDDGLAKKMPGSQPIDDEGVKSQVTTLIDSGVLVAFVNDLHSAKKLGVDPTGNGMRGGLGATPKAGFTTLTMKPGNKTLSEMIAGIKRGILIDQIMGAHQASPFSGDFSVSVDLGFLIEDGQIVGRFKDTMLSGNVFKMLSEQIVEIGSELKYTGLRTPPVLFDGLALSAG